MPDGSITPFALSLLWVLFAAGSSLAAVLGLALTYHWVRFSMNSVVPLFAIIAYSGGCIFFLFVMFVAVISL